MEQTAGRDSESLRSDAHVLPKQNLEVNPAHPVIVALDAARVADPALAAIAAEQLVDNALVAAGLVEDSRVMLPRLNALLERVLGAAAAGGAARSGAAASSGGGGSGYTTEEAVTGARFVPPRERDERAALAEGQRFYEGLHERIVVDEAAAAEAAKAGGR